MPHLQEIPSIGCEWADLKKPFGIRILFVQLLAILGLATTIYGESSKWGDIFFDIAWIFGGFALCYGLWHFVTYNIIGYPIYIWMEHDMIHVRKADWWAQEANPVFPTRSCLRIWIGGWFRRDMLYVRGVISSWKPTMKFSILTGRPKYLVLRDGSNNAVIVTDILTWDVERDIKVWFWNTHRLAQVLVLGERAPSMNVLLTEYATLSHTENDQVAGRVGASAG